VDDAVMLRFMENTHAEHGGAAHWLLANGLSAAELESLREALVSA
jgi:protein-tyrosine phosphatase